MITKGQKISDRYQIVKNIGEGGMANVYLARDTILDRDVAVKVLRGDLSTDEKFVRRFQREALAASSLTNPNIVEVFDVGEDSGNYYIVMEYVKGCHLKNLIKKRGKLSVAEVVDIALQITNGLSVAHDSYLIHRDIKPQNILILDNGLIKITDFGIAVAMNATQLTQTNSVMGSVHYLPPEQAMGKSSSLQSDIYSIGILIYELLAGTLPFNGDNAVEIALKHLKEKVPYITEENDSIPQTLENIIIRSTAKNPKNRYPDARSLHDDLLTCTSESRSDELRIKLKYPETDYDETKVMQIVNANNEDEEDPVSLKETVKAEEEADDMKKKKKSAESKRQNKTLLVLASIFTGLVVIVTTIVLLIPSLTSNEQVAVPDVSGYSASEAIKMLQEVGFVVSDDYVEEPSKDYGEGEVIRTNPYAGTERKSGSTIKLYISVGDVSLVIDDYVGKDSTGIKEALTILGLQVFIEEKEVDNPEDYEEGEIIEQSVEPSTELSEGDMITLYTAKKDVYPNFLEELYTLEEVEDLADKYNLTLDVEQVQTGDYKAGVIFYQNRVAGDTIISGYTLKIKVAIDVIYESDVDSEVENSDDGDLNYEG